MSHRSKQDYKECAPSRVSAYRGLRKPRCNGGRGCNRCWDKYHAAKRSELLKCEHESTTGVGLGYAVCDDCHILLPDEL